MRNHASPILKMCRGLVALLVCTVLFVTSPAFSQGEDQAAEFYAQITEARLQEGLPPLYRSSLLDQAARRHVEDIAARGVATDEGSDGSTYQQRIRETGYRAWNDGLMVAELTWMGMGRAADAVTWFRNHPDLWAVFVDRRYREVGIGYAEDGRGRHYFVITFGSRPNVLPIFINDGASFTDNPVVAVTLTNEEAVPMGEGMGMGRAIEVRLSSTPDFEGADWQPWEALLPWTLGGPEAAVPEPGDYAVYVEFRDGAGRTTVSEATIRLVPPGELPTPTPHHAVAPVMPTAAVMPSSTPPPPPTATPTVTATPLPTPTSSPTLPFVPITPPPTWTPLPTPTVERAPVDAPLIAVVLLQGIALVLAFAAFLRRARP